MWNPTIKAARFPLMTCPSDSSGNPAAPFALTSYVANWNALGDSVCDNPDAVSYPAGSASAQGVYSPAQQIGRLTDGASNVILFAEAYQVCATVTRTAFMVNSTTNAAPMYEATNGWGHNFGITANLPSGQYFDGTNPDYPPPSFTFNTATTKGMPNTLMFQIQPKLKTTFPLCNDPAENCCDEWRAQSSHTVMQVGMADGSVRSVTLGISKQAWSRAMLPRDGEPIPDDPNW